MAAQARHAERLADGEKFEKLIENLKVGKGAGMWVCRQKLTASQFRTAGPCLGPDQSTLAGVSGFWAVKAVWKKGPSFAGVVIT
jgi:hypothetical protein